MASSGKSIPTKSSFPATRRTAKPTNMSRAFSDEAESQSRVGRGVPTAPSRAKQMGDPIYSITTKELNLWYAKFQALIDVTVNIRHGIITSLIGPSGCGKTTLLRCFNRVNERYGYVTTTGEIKIQQKNIYDADISL